VSALATSTRISFDHAFEAHPPGNASHTAEASARSKYLDWKRSLVSIIAFDAAFREFDPGTAVGFIG
jgi:hypothetical protein